MTDLLIRDLLGMDEFRAAEDLQRTVWGKGDQPDPADLMMVIQHEGGLVAGAFQGAKMIGYIFGFPTRDPLCQHSQRLAVLAEARGLGLATRLKFHQRDWCLTRGITRVRWTYDPLRAPNAALNIGRLGAEARTYFVDYYGAMEGINKGVPSDRLLAEWALDSARVAALAAGGPTPAPAGAQRVTIPADFGALLAADPAVALAERMALRDTLQSAFADGKAIVGFDSAAHSYILA
jgi:predicted GNAT superfamily acetyltransferase